MAFEWLYVAFVVAAVTMVFSTIVGGCVVDSVKAPPEKFWIIGHRGAPTMAPENTIESFDAAVDAGANGLEIDLSMTRDGHVVLWHDHDPNSAKAIARQLGGEPYAYRPRAPALGSQMRRPVHELSLNEFRAHYGYVADEDDAPRHDVVIPTLDEFVAWLRRTPAVEIVYFDIKTSQRAVEIFEALWDRRLRYSELEAVRLIAMNEDAEAVREMMLRRDAIGADAIGIAWDHDGASGALAQTLRLGVRHLSLGRGVVELWFDYVKEVRASVLARERGEIHSVIAWTFNDRDSLEELTQIGVDGVITDRPDRLRKMVTTP